MPGTPTGYGGLQMALQPNGTDRLVCPKLLLQVGRMGGGGGQFPGSRL